MRSCKKVSVLMGIYNCESTLDDAILSIVNQTYQNWELIICDDGSTDRSLDIARKWKKKEPRIILLKNSNNQGLNKTLNHCLCRATGEYIARMDGDDVCVPERFEKQVQYLEGQSDYAIVSSEMYFFDEDGVWGKNNKDLYPSIEQVVCGTPICHAPVMMRKECMDYVQGYTEDVHMLRVEDTNLWIKLYAAGYRCCNILEPLYGMRNDKNAVNRRKYR